MVMCCSDRLLLGDIRRYIAGGKDVARPVGMALISPGFTMKSATLLTSNPIDPGVDRVGSVAR